jgi:pantoate--beta-alanine ligase
VNPDKAFFGEKDFQQLMIVQKLVQKEKLSLEIIGCPIHRQIDGLAMSSRNARLTDHQLAIAPFIYQVLTQVKNDFTSMSAAQLHRWVIDQFKNAPGLELEYFEIANIVGLQSLSRKRKHQKYRAFLAVYAGDVRLIDNIALNY